MLHTPAGAEEHLERPRMRELRGVVHTSTALMKKT